jgi:hypothetical protein
MDITCAVFDEVSLAVLVDMVEDFLTTFTSSAFFSTTFLSMSCADCKENTD